MGIWARKDGRGLVFDSSTGFSLPNGSTRSPDVFWVLRERLARLTAEEKRRFLPLSPDLVIELASPTDQVDGLQDKMGEYQENGVRLGWLILPNQRRVYVNRRGATPQRLNNPDHLTDDPLLPGLSLDLTQIWKPGF